MPFNLLIFPIVGGYYVLIRSELFRYKQQRVDRQKLIFNSILAGIAFLFVSWIFTGIASYIHPSAITWIRNYYPFKTAYFGTAICSFIIAVIFTEVSNWIVSKDKSISRAIDSIGNEFERLCDSCYRNTEFIQITLSNDKVYVGWMKALPIPSFSNYISILPVYSGYRDKDTKELVFTTQYLDVYATYISDGDVTSITDLTTLIIKIDDIVTASKFDDDMYDRFLNQPGQKEPIQS